MPLAYFKGSNRSAPHNKHSKCTLTFVKITNQSAPWQWLREMIIVPPDIRYVNWSKFPWYLLKETIKVSNKFVKGNYRRAPLITVTGKHQSVPLHLLREKANITLGNFHLFLAMKCRWLEGDRWVADRTHGHNDSETR